MIMQNKLKLYKDLALNNKTIKTIKMEHNNKDNNNIVVI